MARVREEIQKMKEACIIEYQMQYWATEAQCHWVTLGDRTEHTSEMLRL